MKALLFGIMVNWQMRNIGSILFMMELIDVAQCRCNIMSSLNSHTAILRKQQDYDAEIFYFGRYAYVSLCTYVYNAVLQI